MIREALFYSKIDDDRVHCRLCPAECHIRPGGRGICGSRFNDDGRLLTDNFGETVTLAIDPIEKKPLYHFFPASDIVSIGANGCNLSCRHCQNWEISQEKTRTFYIPLEKLPETAAQRGSIGVAYTYTEPVIWFEYILEAAPKIRDAGLVNVMVTNGYINPEPLRQLIPLIDAFNIDLKGMQPEFYRRICKAKLEPVLETIRQVAQSSAHLEVTYLIIPGLNDSDDDFHQLGRFLASVKKNIPLHLSAYHPNYKLDNPPTPRETMVRACEITDKYLTYVYAGNMQIEGRSDTCCPDCGNVLIQRVWYRIESAGIDDKGACRNCGRPADVVTSKT